MRLRLMLEPLAQRWMPDGNPGDLGYTDPDGGDLGDGSGGETGDGDGWNSGDPGNGGGEGGGNGGDGDLGDLGDDPWGGL